MSYFTPNFFYCILCEYLKCNLSKIVKNGFCVKIVIKNVKLKKPQLLKMYFNSMFKITW